MPAVMVMTADCREGCGRLGEARSDEQPQRRRGPGWSRLDELDSLADRHGKVHATTTHTVLSGEVA